MKKLLAILLVLCMVIPAAALGEEVVKIGVYEPATGDSGAGGKQEMLGMQYANELFPTVKIGDTEYKVELVRMRKALYEDLKHRRDPLIWQDAAKRQLIDNKKL